MVPTTAPTVKNKSIPKWVASFFRWVLSRRFRWRSSVARPTPIWRTWLLTKVVATDTPSAWRKVLYCMEARKLMNTWEICTGAESGIRPRPMTARISMASSSVSQRMKNRCLTGLGTRSETKAPRM